MWRFYAPTYNSDWIDWLSMANKPKLILASGSPRRLMLLQQIGVKPDQLLPTEIDESPQKFELPKDLAQRLAQEKAESAYKKINSGEVLAGGIILAADTVVAVGRRILPKAETKEVARDCLKLLSGRNHRVYTGVHLIPSSGDRISRLVETRVRFSQLTEVEIRNYIASGECLGKAGGYAIQGLASRFVAKIIGSYSNVVGLPLYETANLLDGVGYLVSRDWSGISSIEIKS